MLFALLGNLNVYVIPMGEKIRYISNAFVLVFSTSQNVIVN